MTERNTSLRTTESLSVLIVDDEVGIAETLADFIQELGYTPLVAYNGLEALALARKRWPALVITDFMMPILNGLGLLKALRAEAAEQRKTMPPVIMLSAVNTIAAMRDEKADAMLAKPFDLDELERIIERFLSQ
ncbi:response regulator [Ktedonospora formicarum]|uniref:Response regulatory domain-containing protein n=1 Tax=Ktedonospora formicarum TaxID=2778364 RepID=A0A8J3HZX0_9CHLR|nr:response regulator [Ktedonospora formicarum]GHO46251.1 hypothetical protein KSX_44140 [Ktedonospora formicarum]